MTFFFYYRVINLWNSRKILQKLGVFKLGFIHFFRSSTLLWLKKKYKVRTGFRSPLFPLLFLFLFFFGFLCVCFPMWLEYKMRFSLRINILRCRSLCTHISLRSSSLPYPKLKVYTYTRCLLVHSLNTRSHYNKNKRKVFHAHTYINQIFSSLHIYDYNVLQPVWFNFELKCSWCCCVASSPYLYDGKLFAYERDI